MPYQYLTFSDLYEEEVRSSAPSSPVMGASASPSLSPVFLLPTSSPSHASTSYRHHHIPTSSHDSHRPHHHHLSHSHSHRRARRDVHDHSTLQTYTSDLDDVASPTSNPSSSTSTSSSLHLDFLRVFKRKASLKSKKSHASDSAFSTPASSRRSSFTSYGFASLHPVSAASSANTSPAISRQVTKMSDYEAMVQRTVRAEEQDEQNRQRELQAYFNQAAETGLSLRRF
ncbi:uncharacterized protein UTRI_10487_B [Ustilago trichophora]|uniref:Uncharacterized protein n=1 Tax=Ustilago trichophora TaxID=86804 RepID=A0A5C3EBT2_9BASI|nr:uncharacterized protein UTRI_10487_B [Ustilago trichophora]